MVERHDKQHLTYWDTVHHGILNSFMDKKNSRLNSLTSIFKVLRSNVKAIHIRTNTVLFWVINTEKREEHRAASNLKTNFDKKLWKKQPQWIKQNIDYWNNMSRPAHLNTRWHLEYGILSSGQVARLGIFWSKLLELLKGTPPLELSIPF